LFTQFKLKNTSKHIRTRLIISNQRIPFKKHFQVLKWHEKIKRILLTTKPPGICGLAPVYLRSTLGKWVRVVYHQFRHISNFEAIYSRQLRTLRREACVRSRYYDLPRRLVNTTGVVSSENLICFCKTWARWFSQIILSEKETFKSSTSQFKVSSIFCTSHTFVSVCKLGIFFKSRFRY